MDRSYKIYSKKQFYNDKKTDLHLPKSAGYSLPLTRLVFEDDYMNVNYEKVTVEGRDHIQIINTPTEGYITADFICEKADGDVFTNQTIKCGVKIIKKAIGLPFYFHMIRHTHATMLIENGANIKDVQERLGHTDIKITMNTYSHVTPRMRKQTVDIFEKAIL